MLKMTRPVFLSQHPKGNYNAKAIIISTGSRHRRLKVPGEIDFIGRGVCYCATCDGPLYQDKNVIVVGGGNAAVQEAIYLESLGCHVTIIHRRDQLEQRNTSRKS